MFFNSALNVRFCFRNFTNLGKITIFYDYTLKNILYMWYNGFRILRFILPVLVNNLNGFEVVLHENI